MSGTKTRYPVMRWAPAKLTKTNGENPKISPPTNAAGVQRTQRRRSQNIDSPASGGPSVDATFRVATGPKSHVTGAKTVPTNNVLVFDSRSIPEGWNIVVEKNG